MAYNVYCSVMYFAFPSKVRYGDQLKIESVKTQGQFFHCSNRTLGFSAANFNVLTDW